MTVETFLKLLGIIALGLNNALGQVQTGPIDNVSVQCNSLAQSDFSKIPDALTHVIEANLVDPDSDTVGYCQVTGYVAPSVGFVLRLPIADWNGKFIKRGCGGPCGSTKHIVACDEPLRRGYACIVSDGGHRSGRDWAWAFNDPQAVVDYLVRASHVTALAGKAIATRFYRKAPQRSYFWGCSAGGMQAMWAAQNSRGISTGLSQAPLLSIRLASR
jgi:feruloyl esterase